MTFVAGLAARPSTVMLADVDWLTVKMTVLLYTGEDFVQLIEGAPDRVEATWRRIRADPRHVEVVALLDERDVQAWFADWRVGYLADAAFSRTLAEWRERGRWDGPGSRQAMRLRFAGADSL